MTGENAGRIICIHGGKAGEGKSFLAQNLAAVLARQYEKVLLFDIDFQGRAEHKIRGNFSPGNTLADIAGQISQFDENTIHGYFPVTPSGVTLATLADSEQAAMGVASQQILKALQLFCKAYDVIMIDGLQGWDALTLSVLDMSAISLLVCSPDLVGLKQERMEIMKYRELKFPAAKIGLVLNRADVADALQKQDLEKTLSGHLVLAALPFESHATEALNQHTEIVTLFPNAAYTKALKGLAKTLEMSAGRQLSEEAEISESTAKVSATAKINRIEIKERIHALLLDNSEIKAMASEASRTQASQAVLREKVEAVVTSLMAMEAPELTVREERERLVQEVVDEALGLGPLEDLIRDPKVTEIMVNHKDQIYVERSGKLELCEKHFLSDKQLMTVIERIVAPLGRRIDESQPYVDARLADGSRVNAIIPPLALKGPSLTIRKFSKQRLTVDDLITFGSLTEEWAAFLGACVMGRKNMVISGGTGSGKTTLLNIVASYIPDNERIVTVEDAAELNLPQAHVITLESRPANIEGKGAITIRDLVRNCLRMRPDRIVVGECRGGEALDMLQAMNTGHDGSLTTAHANSPKDTISRLETMVLMSGMDLPVRAIREQIAGAVHLVVQQSRLQDGSRRVTEISEVTGISDGQVVLQDIFSYKQTGLDKNKKVIGTFQATGYVPPFVKELVVQGIEIDPRIFKKNR